MRIRIDLAYDGGGFAGWAAQPRLRTVQGEVESALATALRLPEVRVVVAGRTDAGVHARGQVCHLDVEEAALAASAGRATGSAYDALARRLNGILPTDVRIRSVAPAPEGFDARFSAIWRRYVYRLDDGFPDPLTRGYVVAWPRALDAAAMHRAAQQLLGLRDFAAYCKQREGATTVRTLLDLAVVREEDGVIAATVRADAFCHSMVRALVGGLLAVGEGRRDEGWPAEILAGRVRDPAVIVAAAHGLTLEEVGYPHGPELAAQADRARAKREGVHD